MSSIYIPKGFKIIENKIKYTNIMSRVEFCKLTSAVENSFRKILKSVLYIIESLKQLYDKNSIFSVFFPKDFHE